MSGLSKLMKSLGSSLGRVFGPAPAFQQPLQPDILPLPDWQNVHPPVTVRAKNHRKPPSVAP